MKHGFENWVPMGLFAALLLVGGCGAPPEEEPIVIEEPGGVGSFCYSDNDCTTSEICMVAECVDSICGIKQAPGGTTCDDGDVCVPSRIPVLPRDVRDRKTLVTTGTPAPTTPVAVTWAVSGLEYSGLR